MTPAKQPARKKVDPLKTIKVVIEKHADGYVAYPIGLRGACVGQGVTYEEALADVKSAIKFHVETFGDEVIEESNDILQVFIAEAVA